MNTTWPTIRNVFDTPAPDSRKEVVGNFFAVPTLLFVFVDSNLFFFQKLSLWPDMLSLWESDRLCLPGATHFISSNFYLPVRAWQPPSLSVRDTQQSKSIQTNDNLFPKIRGASSFPSADHLRAQIHWCRRAHRLKRLGFSKWHRAQFWCGGRFFPKNQDKGTRS